MKKKKQLSPNYEYMYDSALHLLQDKYRKYKQAKAGFYGESFIDLTGSICYPKFWADKIDEREKEFFKALEKFRISKEALISK